MNLVLHIDGKPVTLEKVVRKAQEVSFTLAGKTYHFHSHRLPDGSFVLERESSPGVWQRMSGAAWQTGKGARCVQLGALEAKISEQHTDVAQSSGPAALSPTAPMPGIVRKILVKAGEAVTQGQPLAIMEAMKLQLTLSAGGDATVEELLASEGELVAEGAELVKLKAKP